MTKFKDLMNCQYDFDENDSAYYDYQEALEGDEESMYTLGLRYMQGDEVEVDYEKAYFWLDLAVQKGVEEAKNNLAILLLNGVGCNQDVDRAKGYLIDLAQNDDVDAQNNLAYFSFVGEYFTRNRDFILKYARAAAEQGEEKSANIVNLIERLDSDTNDAYLEGKRFYDFLNKVQSCSAVPQAVLYEVYSTSDAQIILDTIEAAENGEIAAIEKIIPTMNNNEEALRYWYQKYINHNVNAVLEKQDYLDIAGRKFFQEKFVKPYQGKSITFDYDDVVTQTNTYIPTYLIKILNFNSHQYAQGAQSIEEQYSSRLFFVGNNIAPLEFVKSLIRIVLIEFKSLEKKRGESSFDLTVHVESFFRYVISLVDAYTYDTDELSSFDGDFGHIFAGNETFDVVSPFKNQALAFVEKMESHQDLLSAYDEKGWDSESYLSVEGSFFNLLETTFANDEGMDSFKNIMFSLVALHNVFQFAGQNNEDYPFHQKMKIQKTFMLSTASMIERYKFLYDRHDLMTELRTFWTETTKNNFSIAMIYQAYGIEMTEVDDDVVFDEDWDDENEEADTADDLFAGLDESQLTAQTREAIEMYHTVMARDEYKSQIDEAYAWLKLILEDTSSNAEAIKERYQEINQDLLFQGMLNGLNIMAHSDESYQEELRVQSKTYRADLSHLPELKIRNDEAYLSHALEGCVVSDGVMSVDFKVKVDSHDLSENPSFRFYDSKNMGTGNMTRLGHIARVSTEGFQELTMNLEIDNSSFSLNIYFEYDVPYGFISSIEQVFIAVNKIEKISNYFVLDLTLSTREDDRSNQSSAHLESSDEEKNDAEKKLNDQIKRVEQVKKIYEILDTVNDIRYEMSLVSILNDIDSSLEDLETLYLESEKDLIYNNKKDKLKKVDKSTKLKTVAVREGIDGLLSGTFRNCQAVENVILPRGIKTINDKAFQNCVNLQRVLLPPELEKIGVLAFENTPLLKTLTIPSETRIESLAFSDSGLSHVDLSAQKIHRESFKGAINLEEVTLSDDLEIIEYEAFRNCTSLKKIIIPKSVVIVEKNVFKGCKNLIIHCEIASEPLGWHQDWNTEHLDVVWDCLNPEATPTPYESIDKEQQLTEEIHQTIDKGFDLLERHDFDEFEDLMTGIQKISSMKFVYYSLKLGLNVVKEEVSSCHYSASNFLIEYRTQARIFDIYNKNGEKTFNPDRDEPYFPKLSERLLGLIPPNNTDQNLLLWAFATRSETLIDFFDLLGTDLNRLNEDYYNCFDFYCNLPTQDETFTSYVIEKGAYRSRLMPNEDIESFKEINDRSRHNVPRIDSMSLMDSKDAFFKYAKYEETARGLKVTDFNPQAPLKTLVIPPNMTSWIVDMFVNLKYVEEIHIPSTMGLKGNMFSFCQNLKTVYIAPGVDELEDYVFSNNPKLERVYAPLSIESISGGVLRNSLNCTLFLASSRANWNDGQGLRFSHVKVVYGQYKQPFSALTSEACYVATAVYGSYDCVQVRVLRNFRDEFLKQSILGTLFIKFYYFASPKVLKITKNLSAFHRLLRPILDSLVSKLQSKGY